MKVLVVRAHHEPQSFSNALAHQAARTLMEFGHHLAGRACHNALIGDLSDDNSCIEASFDHFEGPIRIAELHRDARMKDHKFRDQELAQIDRGKKPERAA